MSTSIILQDLGSLFIGLLALGGFAAVTVLRYRHCRYAIEALAAIVTYLLAAVPVRLLATHTMVLSQTDARIVNGLLAAVFLAIVIQNLMLAEYERRLQGNVKANGL